ncbi:sulfotransferase [uncultured Eudoraea sp.]|uniref:sulfotransferase n=1 Tax=uncultured Eudoraea sp. TaxID=1035614 RepID=UPI00260ED02F|nr:sulfotransferase [uncultured Eudoraea sp.]
MKNRCKAPVIIIGMHRSGTSMLTRFMEESGIFMGSKKSMGKNEESFFFQRINEWILYQKNVTWDNPYNLQFSNEHINKNIVKVIQKRIASNASRIYFGGKYRLWGNNLLNYSKRWGWKDPKNTLTMDIWSSIFPNAKVIHIYRNPIDVANSLHIRELKIESEFKTTLKTKIKEKYLVKKPIYSQSLRVNNIEEGIKLWEEYIAEALKAETYFKNVIHLGYEEFLTKPVENLKKLSIFLGIEVDADLIRSISSKINKDRIFAFTENEELRKIYTRHKNNSLFNKLNYSKII